MSSSKADRSTAPRAGTKPSKARHVGDRNVAPPAGYRPAGKPKKGERAMEAQLAEIDQSLARGSVEDTATVVGPGDQLREQPVIDVEDDAPVPEDPWWTEEREKAFSMTLQGVPQHQVAAELGRDRHTVARWLADERFETRLYDENVARFKAMRQRRTMQTLRLTDKAERIADKMTSKVLELAEKGKDDLGARLAARDWLQEFREQSRREDEIYGMDRQRVDVSVNGQVQHKHSGKVDVSFKAFLHGSLRKMGVDPELEEVDAARADDALVAVTERALLEGSFLDDLVEREKQEQLAPVFNGR